MRQAKLNTHAFSSVRAHATAAHGRAAVRSRILVIGPKWIGDMVMAQSLFKELKRQAPVGTLDVIGPAWAPDLLDRMPEVDNCWVDATEHGELGLNKRWQLGRTLRHHGYTQAIAMSRSLKSALVPWFARIPQRTGYLGEKRYGFLNDIRQLDTAELPQKVQHYVALGLPPGSLTRTAAEFEQPRLTVDHANRDRLVAKHNLSLQRPIVVLTPGAAHGPAKRWPAGHYAYLAQELIERGYACWIVGSDADRATSREIAAATHEHCVDFCGQTGLDDVIDLMSLSQTVVGNDTGLMHIASAVVPHVVALYGSTHPDYAPPLCDHPVRLWLELDCAPCKAKVCPLGHRRCMYELPVADVVQACTNPDAGVIRSRYNPA